MKYLLLFMLLLLSIGLSFAQQPKLPELDRLILKNHSQIEGRIIEVNNRKVIIEVSKEHLTINKTEIASIYFQGDVISLINLEKRGGRKRVRHAEIEGKTGYNIVSEKETAKRGFYNVTYSSFQFRSDGDFGNNEFSFGVSNTFGYQFSQYTGLGLGVGYYDNSESLGRGKIVPVYAEYRGCFSDKKVSPYYSIAYGLSFGTTNSESSHNSTSSGEYFYPAIGFKSGSDESSFIVDIGVRFYKVTYFSEIRGFGGVNEIEETTLNRNFTLRIGVML